jgi:hypothetical protein
MAERLGMDEAFTLWDESCQVRERTCGEHREMGERSGLDVRFAF